MIARWFIVAPESTIEKMRTSSRRSWIGAELNRNHFDGKSVNGTGLRTTLKITENRKILIFLKLEFLKNAGEKPKRKSYIFIKEKDRTKYAF